MSVAAVILAAGFSRRLGRPKQSVLIAGETLLARAVRIARQAGLDPVFAVVRKELDCRSFEGSGCRVVESVEAGEGIAASIRAGVGAVQAIGSCEGLVLMTCDQVGTTAEHLRALCAETARVTGSGYAGKAAVPAYFPRGSFGELVALRGDVGARALLKGAHTVTAAELEVDVDTEEDVARARVLFESAP